MPRSPSGPWYTAYMPAITASSTCAVQMLLVAFSRRMCCSRVCNASRYAGLPSASRDTPTRRPGSIRSNPERTARYPAWGPPKPIGTPNRWVVPAAMSAPASPGGRSSVNASRSAATHTSAPTPWAAATSGAWSRTAPDAPGYCTCRPKNSAGSSSTSRSSTRTSMPSGCARLAITAMVCGNASASTTYTGLLLRDARRARVIASAAAVPSSSIDAFAVARPVRSVTIVWKFSSASSRPWLISGWYGVYAVYQAGFSSTLRRITAGVCVPWYPRPIMDTATVLRAARARSSARASCSLAGSGRSRVPCQRITSGIAASISSSIDS